MWDGLHAVPLGGVMVVHCRAPRTYSSFGTCWKDMGTAYSTPAAAPCHWEGEVQRGGMGVLGK